MKFFPDRRRAFWLTIIFAVGLAGLFILLALLQQILVPVLVYIWPDLDTPFYDLGFFGPYRTRDYVSFNLSSPRTSVVRWEDSCDEGQIFIDPSGPSVDHRGPMILDARGNLIWTNDQFDTTTNLKVQRYRGQDFLTFWSGQKAKTMGSGHYFLMDDTYTIVHKVGAVGAGVSGDLHEFKITTDDTALMTIYNTTQADLTGMGWFRTEHGWITDSVFQEVDIATGRLLFEWRASDHFNAADGYMTNPFGGYSSSVPFDFFHINSIEKDSNSNYLICSRHFHSVMTIDGKTGEVLWELGGRAEDFEDLSNGLASDFSWQHDARWLDEEHGLLTLFDNSYAWPHSNAAYSQGRLIKVDLEAHTAELMQTYVSLQHARSSSQGSVQLYTTTEGEQHVFIGWGSSAVYTEHTPEGELLCETHFGASGLFWWERAKSYRAFKYLDWRATPAEWDPNAAIEDGKLFVSWNGATEVAYWELQGMVSQHTQEQGQWNEIDVIEKDGFETCFTLPSGSAPGAGEGGYTHFRAIAMDSEHNELRRSNVVTRPAGSVASYVLAAVSAVSCVFAVVGYWQYRRKGWKVSDWRQYAQYTIDRSKYQKLW